MNTFNANGLPENRFFEKDAFLDKKFVVCPAGVPISKQLKSALAEWDIDKVYSEGEIVGQSPFFAPGGEEEQTLSQRVSSEIGAPIEEAEEGARARRRADIALDKEFEAAKVVYEYYLAYAESFYEKFVTTQSINVAEINEKIKEFCVFMRKNRRHVLRLQAEKYKVGAKTYLGEHAVRSTVFAEAIAIQLNFPAHRMIELGVSCFLHEIGMTRLPPKILDSSQPLNEQERKAVIVHPVLSYNILRGAEFPLNICLGALEHHERENGKGYPRGLSKEQISIYAKIIAVVCSYEAATSNRSFKEGKDAYSGIIDILKNNDQQYDPTIVHALLLSLSLYPIGIYVLLSDGRKGQVIDINPEDPKYPVVQIFGEYKANGTAKTIETDEYSVHIIRPLTKEEAAEFKA